ncbi:MAG TPA: hypothetical protein VFG63_09945 [Nocardioidaceae bacterium]|nr:hypothetical protein [Nocardioidaceae bacterium]
MKEETRDWLRPLVLGLGSLLVVSLLIGGVVSVLALGAVDVAGLGGSDDGPSDEPSLYMPSPSPEPSASESPEPATSTPTRTAEPSEPEPDKKRHHRKRPRISLTASPTTVGSSERINLDGRYRGGNGTSLQVQRREGGRWVDFPTSASVNGGTFSTYVLSSRTGLNRFRVLDESSGRHSNAVTVRIR